jgi:subtilisin-like proprotein convertase family protein
MQKYFYLVFFTLLFFDLNAQSKNFWNHLSSHDIVNQRNNESSYTPERFAAFSLDQSGMANYLLNAPAEFDDDAAALLIDLPMPAGKTRAFKVFYSPVMEEGLAAKYPQIRSYKGYAVDDQKTNVRFDIGPKGLRAAIHGKKKIYIDPATENSVTEYIVYYTHDYREDVSGFNLSCGMDPFDILEEDLKKQDPDELNLYPDEVLEFRNTTEVCDSVTLFTYRLALSCTGEWARAHGNTVETVLADMVTSVNRINQIYENEFSVRLLLINDNDQLVWLDPETDPFDIANVGYELLSINTVVLNNTIGVNSYDIGHVFTRSCTDVGGVASLGSVCSAERKGSAVTCHYTNNLNYIITNVMAHEVGHQFSAQHTFNNCNGNESAGSDYEPGGGTTIMAYCGLCGGNNVDYNCLDNFHAHSVEQVLNFTRYGGGRNCATKVSTNNTAPKASLNYKNGFSIPISTPFILEGSATDCEGDQLTYSWEEWDLGPSVPIAQPVEDSPLFTAVEPRDVPYRVFPDMSKIVNSFSNNSEVLPFYTRPMNFRFIVRDNNQSGGGTDWKNVSFRAEGNAGPFLVTGPASVQTYTVGDELEITWDVANTDIHPVNCKQVNILMSADGGYTYPILLKDKTPNDGSETVVLPNIESSLVRFKVEAADNIFFDISNYYSKIVQPDIPAYYIEATPLYQQVCLPDMVTVDLQTVSFNGYEDTLRFEVTAGLPEGTHVEFSPEFVIPGESVSLELDLSDVNVRDIYNLQITSISSSGDSLHRTVELDVITNDYSDISIINPLPGSSGIGQVVDLEWTDGQSADLYNVFISKNPSFPENGTISLLNSPDTIFRPNATLEKSTLYYWKIEGINECGSRPASEIMTFSTEAFSCRTFVTQEESKEIRSKQTSTLSINIEEDTQVADVNVIKLGGDHDNFYDLDGSLIGPDGTKVLLFSGKCYLNGAVEFDFGMDDESTIKFKCPPDDGISFYPAGSLSELNGISAKGEWVLEIYDRQSPKGGELVDFELEICANSVLSNPYIVYNESYKVAIGLAWDLPSTNLKVDDEDNLPEELIYTIVQTPQYTDILKNGVILNVGDQFSEAMLRNGEIQLYSATGVNGDVDNFIFTVIDGNGGWLDQTSFAFVLDEKVSVKSIDLTQQLNVYPNPGSDQVFVSVFESGNFEMTLFNLTGQALVTNDLQGYQRVRLDVNGFEPGVYYLKIQNEHKQAVRKLIIQ